MEEGRVTVEEELVRLERRPGGIALVTLVRADKRNAVNERLARQLERLVADLETDSDVRVVVLTGDGKVFSAGADLREVAAGRLDNIFLPGSGFAGFVTHERAKPWVCAVQGPALAGGLEIALACDIILASDAAEFGLPEVTRGLIASAGGLYRLPRLLPRTAAMEMLLTGKPITARQAYDYGLISRVCEPQSLMSEAFAIAQSIAANAPLAVRESLRIARMASGFDDDELWKDGERTQARLQQSADYQEGATAFVEKRQPRWRGA